MHRLRHWSYVQRETLGPARPIGQYLLLVPLLGLRSATFLAALRWSEDYYLVVLGVLSLGAASIGRAARRWRWHGWVNTHLVAMGLSYIVMLTAFYVGEGATLPLGKKLPRVAYWVLPSVIWCALDSEGPMAESQVAPF